MNTVARLLMIIYLSILFFFYFQEKPKMMNFKCPIVCCVILVTLVVRVKSIHTVHDINKLSKELLAGYNKNTLPSANFDQQFQLNIRVSLVALGDIDEIEERLSTVMMFIFSVGLTNFIVLVYTEFSLVRTKQY